MTVTDAVDNHDFASPNRAVLMPICSTRADDQFHITIAIQIAGCQGPVVAEMVASVTPTIQTNARPLAKRMIFSSKRAGSQVKGRGL